ncbi:glutamate-5-semialdehyde dehydrogenase [Leadbetterella byssophila DSM 17132]|uniref:Gamma-glutamyl phosphate reductase n=1 Tax=Leadbetterella byssophila (strain DSM 17132 / JCM 16389 / KACC 11308 / NBRC 106382 / 4M15) TaxID=649349 RepID=E4RRW8_LEAB4|nr:glutamate-5-semialdehyde dehydrogenase [Leadbetterella byssophila]ADQ17655.1 glutamate-5-semialdehyde dehydrogenase [Leadbetterella byssophila DSM 17132]
MLQQTQQASIALRRLSYEQRAALLLEIAKLLRRYSNDILEANAKDLASFPTSDPLYDRLLLDAGRIERLASAVEQVSTLEDPVGKVLIDKILPNGLRLKKITVPMGVIGIIYESRPNVTIDVAVLCLLSGNAAVLKGGKEAFYSNTALVSILHKALAKSGLPTELVQLLPTDRRYTTELLQAEKYVDLIIPRGSQSLINYVRENAKIPCIETGAGVCHTYVAKNANLEMAAKIIINAKGSRPSVCNALDCLIVHEDVVESLAPLLKSGLEQYGISVYADEVSFPYFKRLQVPVTPALEENFGKEWLDYKLSVKTVKDLNEALAHIQKYSSKHSEAILTVDEEEAQRFLQEVDAAAVYHNASTRFTDGGEFGLGAEIGISTQKLHARGPFALEKLVTEKWIVLGEGQIR